MIREHDGELAARISNTVVKALARTTGRGPTKAKTTLGDNGIFVVLQDSLTRGEQSLTDAGEGEAVLDLRRRWQGVMRVELSAEIEELTGRKVVFAVLHAAKRRDAVACHRRAKRTQELGMSWRAAARAGRPGGRGDLLNPLHLVFSTLGRMLDLIAPRPRPQPA